MAKLIATVETRQAGAIGLFMAGLVTFESQSATYEGKVQDLFFHLYGNGREPGRVLSIRPAEEACPWKS